MNQPIAPTTVIKALTKVKARIEKGWTQNSNACDAEGRPVLLYGSGRRVVCWCLHGAVEKTLIPGNPASFRDNNTTPRLRNLIVTHLNAAVGRSGYTPLERGFARNYIAYNDEPGRTKEEVIALVDNTIKHIEEHGL